MGARGPAPKPRLAVVREGGKVRERHRSQPVVPHGAPVEPDWAGVYGLTPEAAELAHGEWVQIIPALDAARMLTGLDRSVIEDHCIARMQFVELVQRIASDGYQVMGDKGMVRNPDTLILGQVRARLSNTAKALGLSPADRARITSGGATDDGGASESDFTI